MIPCVIVTGEDDIWNRAPCTSDLEGRVKLMESLNPGGTDMRASAAVSPADVLKSWELAPAGPGMGARMTAATAAAAKKAKALFVSPPPSY